MGIRLAMSGIYLDDTLGYWLITVEDRELYMSHETFLDLVRAVRLGEVHDALVPLGDGTYSVPPAASETVEPFDYMAAEELARSLSLTDPEPSAVCIYMPCSQPAVNDRDGFPLCHHHDRLMAGWDDLLAV